MINQSTDRAPRVDLGRENVASEKDAGTRRRSARAQGRAVCGRLRQIDEKLVDLLENGGSTPSVREDHCESDRFHSSKTSDDPSTLSDAGSSWRSSFAHERETTSSVYLMND